MSKQSLNSCLNEIIDAAEALSNQKFKHPGIFHNAIVHHMITKRNKNFVKLMRDVNEKEELSLFKVDPKDGILKRRDGKEGIFDFLSERDAKVNRNRRIGIQEPKPIIQIPSDFYLEQHTKELSNNRKRKSNSLMFDVTNGTSTIISNATTGAFKLLYSKFESEPEIIKLLNALQNGSVFIEDESEDGSDNSKKRRKTMFVEDFSTKYILDVVHEINNLWSLAEFEDEFVELQNEYEELMQKIDQIKSDINKQDLLIKNRYASEEEQSSSNSVIKMIERTKDEIADLEEQIKKLEETPNTTNSSP